MDRVTLRRTVHHALASMAVALLPTLAAAQAPTQDDLSKLSIEDLLTVEVVSSASKFPQAVNEAPASITVITAEEIRRQGHRTLADTLRSVRGFYTSYDRNYAYVGMRGFSRPGDYNTRVLLLVDGHRLNDDIYNQAPLGTDFPIEMSLIDRIEVIRGPGSSLYGTSAMFAVLNVITKRGAARKGAQIDLEGGSLGTGRVAGSYGRLFADGDELLVAASGYRSSGQDRLFYPELVGDESADGIVHDLDHDDATRLFGSFSTGAFTLRTGAVLRDKQVPTASFDTIVGDDRLRTTDNRMYVSGVYDGVFGRGWAGTVRLDYDYYGYAGTYPYDYGEDGLAIWEDDSSTHTVIGEVTARRQLGRQHLLTTGVEVRRNFHNHQVGGDIYGESVNVNLPGTNAAVYAQDEMRPVSWLLVNAGLRVDRFSTFGTRATPRAGLVLLPRPATAIKLVHARAFRAPNPYEREYYTGSIDVDLQPEQVRSTELAWEESISGHLRMTVTGFAYDVEDLIEQRSAGNDSGDIYFVNAGRTSGRGVEAEIEARFTSGVSARFSQSFAHVRNGAGDTAVSNAPRHLSKLSVQVPVSSLTVAMEGQYVGERLTLGGETLGGFFVPNLTITSPAGRRLGFSFSLYNAFDRFYADPGAEEHRQQSIRQDGRTMMFRLHVGF